MHLYSLRSSISLMPTVASVTEDSRDRIHELSEVLSSMDSSCNTLHVDIDILHKLVVLSGANHLACLGGKESHTLRRTYTKLHRMPKAIKRLGNAVAKAAEKVRKQDIKFRAVVVDLRNNVKEDYYTFLEVFGGRYKKSGEIHYNRLEEATAYSSNLHGKLEEFLGAISHSNFTQHAHNEIERLEEDLIKRYINPLRYLIQRMQHSFHPFLKQLTTHADDMTAYNVTRAFAVLDFNAVTGNELKAGTVALVDANVMVEIDILLAQSGARFAEITFGKADCITTRKIVDEATLQEKGLFVKHSGTPTTRGSIGTRRRGLVRDITIITLKDSAKMKILKRVHMDPDVTAIIMAQWSKTSKAISKEVTPAEFRKSGEFELLHWSINHPLRTIYIFSNDQDVYDTVRLLKHSKQARNVSCLSYHA